MKEILLNLNFDDFHTQTDEEGDFGGDLENGNFRYIKALWDEFPGLKITLFTTPNWIDRPYQYHHYFYHIRKLLGIRPVVPHHNGEPFRIDKHPEWCKQVRQWIKE